MVKNVHLTPKSDADLVWLIDNSGLSIREIAKRAGVSDRSIRRLIHGDIPIRTFQWVRILDAIGLKIEMLPAHIQKKIKDGYRRAKPKEAPPKEVHAPPTLYPDLTKIIRPQMQPYEVRFIPRHKKEHNQADGGFLIVPDRYHVRDKIGKFRDFQSKHDADECAAAMRKADTDASDFM